MTKAKTEFIYIHVHSFKINKIILSIQYKISAPYSIVKELFISCFYTSACSFSGS